MLIASTSCFRWYWLHKTFKLVSQSGYKGVNLDIFSWEFDTENANYIKELSTEFWVPVISITAHERKMDSALVDEMIVYAWIVGAKIINFYPPHRADKDTIWFSEYLPKMKQKDKDIDLAVINVEPKTFLLFIPEYKDATLATIKKITWNTTLAISNIDISTWVDLLKAFTILWNSIKNVFLSDRSGSKIDLQLGKWDMPLESLLIRLKENAYKGLFTLKISPKELGVGKDELVLKRLEESKVFFEKHFK